MGVALTRRVGAAGLFLCRCVALYGDLRGGFCCGWCIGCWLFVVGRCTASGGVWWRFVWRVVGRIGCRRFVWRVVGRGVWFLVSSGGAWGGAGVALCVVSGVGE